MSICITMCSMLAYPGQQCYGVFYFASSICHTQRHISVKLAACMQDEYVGAAGSVIAADFYRAGALLPLPDEEVVARVLRNLQFCEPGFLGAKVPSCV